MTPLSKQILTNWLVKEIPDMVLDTDEQYGFGVCGQVNGGPLKCFYEMFVNDLWMGEWPTNWKYIHVPVSKKYLIDNIPSMDSRHLRLAYRLATPNVDLTQEFECGECQHAQEMEVTLTADCFWPDR